MTFALPAMLAAAGAASESFHCGAEDPGSERQVRCVLSALQKPDWRGAGEPSGMGDQRA